MRHDRISWSNGLPQNWGLEGLSHILFQVCRLETMQPESRHRSTGLYRLVASLALTLGIAAIAVFVVSYFFHSTTIDVYAISSPDVVEAFEIGEPAVTVEFYDAPIGGELTGVLAVQRNDVSADDQILRIVAKERTRKLPRGGYLQVCIDGESDGNEECVGTATINERLHDRVSCTRTVFSPERFWLSSSEPAYLDVRCSAVTSPFLLALTADTKVNLDQQRLTLAEGDIADLTALLNQEIIERGLEGDEALEMSIESGHLSVQGAAHEDLQELKLVGSELTISNGNTIDLGALVLAASAGPQSDSDDQLIGASLAGSQLVIELENGGTAVVDLSSLTQDEDNQQLDLTGSELVLSNGIGPDSIVDLGYYLDNTDSFQGVSCAAGSLHILAFNGSEWSCLDPTDAETLTTLGYDAANQTINYVDEDGNQTAIALTALETSTFVSNTLAVGNIIGNYTNEDGAVIDLVETVTSIIDNGDQTFTYTNEAGISTVLDISQMETLTTLTNTVSGNPIGTYTDEAGNAFDVRETVTRLVDNGDGSITFFHEGDSQTDLDIGDLETLTTMTELLASGNPIGEYTNEDGTAIDLLETVTSLVDNGDGTFTFTHEGGVQSTLSVAALETLTEVTNVLVDGHLIGTYVDEDGNSTDLLETVTSVASDGQSLVFTDENGDLTSISMTDLETLTSVINVLADGHLIGTYIDEDGNPTNLLETVTSITNTGQTIVLNQEDGNTSTVDIRDLETLTKLTDVLADGHLIGTYIDEDGNPTKLLETITTLVKNPDGSFSYTNENGDVSTIDVTELETISTLTDVLADGHLIGIYTDEDGNAVDLLETVTSITAGTNGTFTFADEAGDPTVITIADLETLSTVTDVLADGHLIGIYTDEDGNAVDLLETVTTLSQSGSTFTFEHEDGSESIVNVKDLETISTVTDVLTNGHLIGVYTDEDGNDIDLRETVTKLVANTDQTFTFTHEDGSESTINVKDLETLTTVTQVISTGHLIGVYENEAGALVDIRETVTKLAVTGAQELTFTDEEDNDVVINIGDLETLTKLTDVLANGHVIGVYVDENGNGTKLLETITSTVTVGQTVILTHEDGSESKIDVGDLETLTKLTDVLTAGHLIGIYTDEDGNDVDLRETVTKIVANADGTFSFSHEDGSVSKIDIGDLETLTTITNTIAAGNLIATYNNEAGAAVDINETITQLVANPDGTLTYVDETGKKNIVSVSDGIAHPVQTIYEEFYAVASDDGFNATWGRNMKMERIGVGIWKVYLFPDHPDGTQYVANVLTQEQANLRDSVLPWIEQGSKTPSGFTLHLVTGDNGTGADIYVDTPFTVSVNAPVNVLIEGP